MTVRTLERMTAGAACAVAVAAIGCGSRAMHEPTHPARVIPAQTSTQPLSCVEGDPCWNCHTMGNHVCGPQRGGLYITKTKETR